MIASLRSELRFLSTVGDGCYSVICGAAAPIVSRHSCASQGSANVPGRYGSRTNSFSTRYGSPSLRHFTSATNDPNDECSTFDVKGKIKVSNPVVELKGDGISRVVWEMVKSKMIQPYLNLTCRTYDLSFTKFKAKGEKIIQDISEDLKQCNVALKCSTFDSSSSNDNGTDEVDPRPLSHSSVLLRDHVLGALFVEPILIENIPRLIPNWKKPIIVGHHVFGDQYRDKTLIVPSGGTVELVFTSKASTVPVSRHQIKEFDDDDIGLCLGMYASQKSIDSFARCCFRYCLLHKLPLYLSVSNPKMCTFDGAFKTTFDKIYPEFRSEFEKLGLWYETRKFDRMVSQVLQSEGGFLWACKNYDGDVNTDLVSAGFGSKWLTTYTYLSQDHQTCIVEPGHGPIANVASEQPSEDITANPLAIIFTWTRALKIRAKLDGNQRLERFCQDLEAASIETVESGVYTKDLLKFLEGANGPERGIDYLHTTAFMDMIIKNLKVNLVSYRLPRPMVGSTTRLSDRTH